MHFILGAVVALLGYGLTRSLFASLTAGAAMLVVTYISLPVQAWNFAGLWVLLFFGLLLVAALSVLVTIVTRGRNFKPAIWTAFVACLFLSGMWTTSILTSWSFFHADKYQKLLGEVRHATFSTDATILDQSQIRTVSFEVAHKRAEELLGADPGLGSQYKIGDMRKQIVNGHQMWVAPLEYKGLRQWWGNDFTRGYVTVNANDFWDAKLVTEVNGKPIRMKIGEEGYFWDNLHRVVYTPFT
jgi:hypothetical protein